MSKTKPGLWKELRRRGVPKVLTMYAATAFIIMEASEIMLPRLGLPDWTVTLVVILLIVGLPVTSVLSWIFDITPQGVVKTGPLEEEDQTDGPSKTSRRSLRLSDVVIVVLLGVVLVLLYPKLQGRGSLKNVEGGISIAVMPFKNMTGDSLYNVWQGGLQNLMITSLSNSEELSVRQYETMFNILGKESGVNYSSLTPAMAGLAARKVEANTVITGNIYKSGGKVRVTSNIMNPDSEEIFKSFELQGTAEDDLFILTDSLTILIKDFLEIKSIKNKVSYDLKSVYTQSPEAYKLYILGTNYHAMLEYPDAIEHLKKALEIDTAFVSAMIQLAYCYGDTRQVNLSRMWAYKANELILRLPPDMQFLVHILISTVEKNGDGEVYYLEEYLALHPQAMIKHYQLGWVRFNMEEWEEAIKAFETSLELAKKQGKINWVWTYSLLGNAYHHVGEHIKEQRIFDEGRAHWPQHKSTFDYWQAACAISRDDTTQAKYYLDEILSVSEKQGWPEAELWLWYAGAYNWGQDYEQADFFYRKAHALKPENPQFLWEFAQFLINCDINIEEGMEYMAPLVEKYPGNENYQLTYGMGLYKKESYLEARDALQKSWDLRAYYNHKNRMLLKEVDDILDRGQD